MARRAKGLPAGALAPREARAEKVQRDTRDPPAARCESLASHHDWRGAPRGKARRPRIPGVFEEEQRSPRDASRVECRPDFCHGLPGAGLDGTASRHFADAVTCPIRPSPDPLRSTSRSRSRNPSSRVFANERRIGSRTRGDCFVVSHGCNVNTAVRPCWFSSASTACRTRRRAHPPSPPQPSGIT